MNIVQKKDIYDIIIENTTKEWKFSMIDNIHPAKWETPKFSKKQIDRAGKIIVSPDSTILQEMEALEVLNNWRSSHAYPLQVIASNLRRKNPNAIVVQRLKRLDSITGKLKRFPEMSLYRMQDLGGCRVILDDVKDVYESVRNYKYSRIRHILKREDDYIIHQKHLVIVLIIWFISFIVTQKIHIIKICWLKFNFGHNISIFGQLH